MYIATNESQSGCRSVLNALPQALRHCMCNVDLDEATEIRMIAGKPFVIRYSDGDYYLSAKSILLRKPANSVIVSKKLLDEAVERITKSSIYSVREEIRNGYITIEGGHRVGIAGTAVTDNGCVEFIKDISAVNIRIASEVLGAADEVIGDIVSDGIVNSTLIISPPCTGKTTMLRDIARQLSYLGYAVAIADERCEIAAMYEGKSAFDLGNLTTVLDNCPKDRAMMMLLRSMAPDVIITDEIGTERDIEAIRTIINSGVGVIATVHGRDIKQIMRRKALSEVAAMFDRVIILSRRCGIGTVEEIVRND